MELTPGGNAAVSTALLTVRIISGRAADISAFRLYANGKVNGDSDMVFYGQKYNDDRSVELTHEGTNTTFSVDLIKMRAEVQKVAFTLSCEAGQNVSGLSSLSIQVEQSGNILLRGHIDIRGRNEAALILGELYRRNNEWKFRLVAQGFQGGLKPLAELYGIDVAAEDVPAAGNASPPPAPTPPPAPSPAPRPVNLSKVSLTKEKPSISLEKKDDFGKIRINLNWNRGTQAQGQPKGLLGGIFGSSSSKGVDLDLGAFVRTRDGGKHVIQALGNAFGNFDNEPYVKLQGDDRTGAVSDGEWLDINGRRWKDIEEVLIYAFIYEGAPNWGSTDGVVTLHIPDQPPIETRLTEGERGMGMCAIARLVNRNGAIQVERINQYFAGHKKMDNAFNWGFNWSRGSKD